ncbi:hypothetical protein [Okeania sp. SIO1I7]|uniref:hypothetical protein n=1 Tax=Okeania sp. SIO1I7 TaxID=2607772 RepID=UPI0013F99DE7|nr:hypothetical protein [Okeania sp. SIO1I7]NET25036.1 hypothetical protein [Okeania sp. SIO1I7]
MVKRVYDINLNYLGVNPPLAPPPPRRGGEVISCPVVSVLSRKGRQQATGNRQQATGRNT